MTSFEEDLNNLIWERERLNADLTHELTRTHLLSKATTSLRALNDEAEAVVMRTLQGLGLAPREEEVDTSIAPRFAPPTNGHQSLKEVVNRSYGNGMN